MRLREGFIVAALFWSVLGVAGALPLVLTDAMQISFTAAAFESISGLTTTGATVLVGLDGLPRSILFYRALLHWLGGMGIIALAVAILPMLGLGGMRLFRAETPGPVKDAKLTPRIAETAKVLWIIYIGLNVACAVAYWLAGMTPFDAICYSFSALATGGFANHDASIGFFNSALIEMITAVFMVLGATNFALHFAALRRRSLNPYADSEFRAYVAILAVVAAITSGYLLLAHEAGAIGRTLVTGTFQAISIATTTGLTTTGFQQWPVFLPVLLLFSSFIATSASSTGGGLKVIRVQLLYKQVRRELTRLVHPRARVAIKVGGQVVDDRIVQGVWAFIAAYIVIFALGMLVLMAMGIDQVTAFAAMAACLNNMGVGLVGDVAITFHTLGVAPKWVLSVAMLLGRLEIFTFLVLLTPEFWRR